jgi:hypothetical protein
MPYGDGTGPDGNGPYGGGRGPCGRGRGRQPMPGPPGAPPYWGWQYYPTTPAQSPGQLYPSPPSPDQEKAFLTEQLTALEQQISQIRARLESLDKQTPK